MFKLEPCWIHVDVSFLVDGFLVAPYAGSFSTRLLEISSWCQTTRWAEEVHTWTISYAPSTGKRTTHTAYTQHW